MERLLSNVEARNKLTAPLAPHRVRLRARDILLALYLAGDTSGAYFGSVLIKEKGILYQSGTWTQNWKEESSNFRGVDNLVTKMASLVGAGKIRGQDFFLSTDNSTFESAYYQGYPTS